MFHEVFCFPVATKEVWALIFWGLCQFWKHIFTIYYLFNRKSFQGTAKVWQINFCDLFLRLIGKTTVSRNSKPEWLWTILLACTDHLLKYILFLLLLFYFSKGEITYLKKVFRKRGCCERSLTSFQIPTGCIFLCIVLPYRRQRKMYIVALMLSYVFYSLTEPWTTASQELIFFLLGHPWIRNGNLWKGGEEHIYDP